MKYIFNDKCLIHLLSCKVCVQQYIGNTKDHFRSRWSNHKGYVESGNMENVKQKTFPSLFLQSDHQGFLEDVQVRWTDKTQASDPTR